LPAVMDLTLPTSQLKLSVGDSVQLIPSVTLAAGVTKLSGDAVWTSSDEKVATVSSSGLLTVVGNGGADVVATAYEHRASVHVRVPFTITGVVHEGIPTEQVPVSGAKVEIQGGVDSGAVAVTDNEGRFTFEVESVGFTLAVSRVGYDSVMATIAELPRDIRPSIGMVPENIPVTQHFSGNLCTDYDFYLSPLSNYPVIPPYPCRDAPLVKRHAFDVHRGGLLEVDVRWRYMDDYYNEYLVVEIECGGATALHTFDYFGEVRSPGVHWKPAVPSPARCEMTAKRYYSLKSPYIQIPSTTYQIDVTHPK
jgi:hypothetical protein